MLEPLSFIAIYFAVFLAIVFVFAAVVSVIENTTNTIIAQWPEKIREFFE